MSDRGPNDPLRFHFHGEFQEKLVKLHKLTPRLPPPSAKLNPPSKNPGSTLDISCCRQCRKPSSTFYRKNISYQGSVVIFLGGGVAVYITASSQKAIHLFMDILLEGLFTFYIIVIISEENWYSSIYVNNMSRDMTKPTKWLCAQRRLRSAWASAQSDQSLRCALNG